MAKVRHRSGQKYIDVIGVIKPCCHDSQTYDTVYSELGFRRPYERGCLQHSATSDDFSQPFAVAASAMDHLNSSSDVTADINQAVQSRSMSSEVAELAVEAEQMLDAEVAAEEEPRITDSDKAFLQAQIA